MLAATILALAACATVSLLVFACSRVYRVSRIVCTRKTRRAALERIIPPSEKLWIPKRLLTKRQFATCSSAVPAPKIEYDIIRLDDPRPNGGFSHIGLPKGQELGAAQSVAVVLPAMGTTPYTRCIRRLVSELQAHGIAVIINIPRCTKGYAFPTECEPYLNYFLDLEDVASIVRFLERSVGEYREKTSQVSTNPVEVHFVGYSLGAMRAFRILGDPEVFPRISKAKNIRIASVVGAYPSFYPSVYESQGDAMQKLLGKYYCEFIEEHKNWFQKHYGKVGPVAGIRGDKTLPSDPDKLKLNSLRVLPPLDEVLKDGRLRVLDDYITSPFCGFRGTHVYYQEILVHSYKSIGSAPGAAGVPTFIISVADDMMAGPDTPDDLPEGADVSVVVLNHGGHLGTVLSDGRDVCSQLIRAWIENPDAPSVRPPSGLSPESVSVSEQRA